MSKTAFPCAFSRKGPDTPAKILLLPFKAGSLKIAAKTGCPIVPMAITGSADILKIQAFPRVKSTHVVLQYGEPILMEDLSKDDRKHSASIIQKKVETMLTDNQSVLSQS